MICQSSESIKSQKSERTLHKSPSFIMRTDNQMVTIKGSKKLFEALKQLKQKRNREIRYIKFQGCCLESIELFLYGLRKCLSNQEESLLRIVCHQCRLNEADQNFEIQPTKITEKQKFFKAFPKFLSTSNTLSDLATISFSKCSIFEFPDLTRFISDLQSLRTLDLSTNQIKTLSGTALDFLQNISINFKSLILLNNPLDLIQTKILQIFPNKIEFQLSQVIEGLQLSFCQENISVSQIFESILSKQDFYADKLFRKLILSESVHYCKKLLLIIKEYFTTEQTLVFAQEYLSFINFHRKCEISQIFLDLFPEILLQQLPNFCLYKMMLFKTIRLNPPIAMPILSQYINTLGQQFESSENRKKAFSEYIKSGSFFQQLNTLIQDEMQFEELIDTIEYTTALLLMLKQGVFKFIETSQFTSQRINHFLLSFNDWVLIRVLCRDSSGRFISKIMLDNFWKTVVRPNNECYRMLRKIQKQHIKDCFNISNGSNFENLREYIIPKQYILRNDIHDYSILRQYEEFHSSFSNKDYSQVLKYRNKENKFSIAKKIEEQIRKKEKLPKTSDSQGQTEFPLVKKIVLRRVNMKDITNFLEPNLTKITKNKDQKQKQQKSQSVIHCAKRVSINLKGPDKKKTGKKGLEILSCRNRKMSGLQTTPQSIFENSRNSAPSLSTYPRRWVPNTLSISQFD